MFGLLRKLLAGNDEQVLIKKPRQPTSSSGFSKWSARSDRPSTESVKLKKWPWYSRKPLETIQFKYQDREGEYSIRTVDVFSTTHSYFTGYCYIRKATRTFKSNRVIGPITVVQTGEIMPQHEWSSAIYGHPNNRHDVDMGGY